MRSIFAKSLYDQRKALIGWGIGLAALVASAILIYPSIRDTPGLEELTQRLPDAVTAVLGEQNLLSPEGYVNGRLLFSLVPLAVLVVAIGRGADTIAGEESRGTLAFLLSLPVSRRRVMTEKLLALAAGLAVLAAVLFLAMWASDAAVDLGIAPGGYAAASAGALLLGLAFGWTTIALAAATGNRALAVGTTAGVAFATYLLHSLAQIVEALEPFQALSPFYWFIGQDPLRNGIRPAVVAVLLGIAVVAAAVALITFERRDIGV